MPKHVPNKNKKYTNNQKTQNSQPKKELPKSVTYKTGMTVGDFADQIKRPAADVIKKLMFLKIMATKNQTIDRESCD